MTTTASRATQSTSDPNASPRWAPLILLATAQLMLVLDVTVVTVALPDIGSALHLHRDVLPWVITTYTLFFGGLMLLGGRVADIFGARRSTLTGLAAFVVASLLCGSAGNAGMLLTGRALQGIAAALLSPAALATVMWLYTGRNRARALGTWAALSGVGAALGVVLGGLLTSEASWRWIFTINVPIGVTLLIAMPLVTPAQPATASATRGLDVPGAVLVTTGTGTAIYGLINAGGHGWTAPSTWVPLLAAVVLWAALAAVERRTTEPLLRLPLLTRRPSLAGSFLMLAATALMVGGFFLGSFALQHAYSYSALHVGLVFLPVAVATIVGARTASQVLQRIPARSVAAAGLGLAVAGYLVAAISASAVLLVVGLTVATLGIGATFVTAFTAALSDAPAAEAGLRSALVNTFHELGGAAGVAGLSSATGVGLVGARVGTHTFAGAFTLGAIAAAAAVLLALQLVPSVLRIPPPIATPTDPAERR